jgi:hypothetical protein
MDLRSWSCVDPKVLTLTFASGKILTVESEGEVCHSLFIVDSVN